MNFTKILLQLNRYEYLLNPRHRTLGYQDPHPRHRGLQDSLPPCQMVQSPPHLPTHPRQHCEDVCKDEWSPQARNLGGRGWLTRSGAMTVVVASRICLCSSVIAMITKILNHKLHCRPFAFKLFKKWLLSASLRIKCQKQFECLKTARTYKS